MEIGSLVVQTKKLNKTSSFSIRTPTGTAGIRGTQFQLASSPNTGMQLDVAESQVAFTPAGQNQPVVVGPGRGLDSSPSGQIKQRPINPIVSQNISSKNSVASSFCAAVPLATAKQANSKSASSSSKDGRDEDSADDGEENGDSEGDDKSDDDGGESEAAESFIKQASNSVSAGDDKSDGDGGESEAAESFIKQASNSVRQVSGQETNSEYLKKVLGLLNPTSINESSNDDLSGNTDIPASPGFTPSTRPVSDFEIAQDPVNPDNTLDFIPISPLKTPDGTPIAVGTPIELTVDWTRQDLYDLLDEWLPDQEFDWINVPEEFGEDLNPYFYTASIALEQFLDAPDYSYP